MKAVVIAAGKGTRLHPLTLTRPKPLLPVGGRPLLEWTLRGLADAGVREIVLVTNYMEEKIRERFGDGSGLGLGLSYVRQEKLGGTANAFGAAEGSVGEGEFVGMYGDVFLPPGALKKVVGAHRAGELTMTAAPVGNPSQYGVLELEGSWVRSVVEKPLPGTEPSNLANAGVYVFPSGTFGFIRETGLSSRGEYEITDTVKAMMGAGTPVRAVRLGGGEWLDIGLPWNLLEANRRALSGLEPYIGGVVEPGACLHGPVRVEEGARVRSGAYIEGPVVIGGGSDVGPNCHVRPSTSIGRNVRIGNACEVKNSIVMDGTHIPHLSYVGDSIIGENCNLGAGTITANLRFDEKNIKATVKGERLDTGMRKLGAIIGDNAQTGINVSLMPGVKVGPNAWIAPGLTVYEDVAGDILLISRQEHEERPK